MHAPRPPYEQYAVADFLRDDFFRDWVTHPDESSEQFWRQWLRDNPRCEQTVWAARQALLASSQPSARNPQLTEAERGQLWQRIRHSTAELPAQGTRPGVRRPRTNIPKLRTDMLRHYFRVALRNAVRQKAISAINVFGLAIGMASSLLILLWVRDEGQVDRFHANGPHLYALYHRSYSDGKIEAGHFSMGPLPDELKKTIPGIGRASGLLTGGQTLCSAGGKTHIISSGGAGADFFSMFSYPLLAGTPETALSSPTGAAISRKVAELYFGSPGAAMGKMLRLDNREDWTVTAVFENLPPYASDQFDCLLSWTGLMANSPFMQAWKVRGNGPRTYVQLHPGADPGRVEAKLKGFLEPFLTDRPGYRVELALMPFGDKYLYSDFRSGTPDGGRIVYVRLFTAVALFIVLIACINFMNLSTARAARRAREVGVRKVLGTTRRWLVGQFIGETMLIAFLAAALSLLLAAGLMPAFNALAGKTMSLPVGEPADWFRWLGLVTATGLVAGIYPAFFMSSFRPVQVLKGTLQFGRGAVHFRQALVVFQFALSILLTVVTLVVARQMAYVQSKHLGYDREHLLHLPLEGELATKYSLFKEQVAQLPGVAGVDRTAQLPYNMSHSTLEVDWEGKDPNSSVVFTPSRVGFDYVTVMGLRLAAGRNFSREYATDSAAYLVNEEAVRRMGLRNPLGKAFTLYGKKGTIVGVLRDFHAQSLHEPIKPLVLGLNEQLPFGLVLVRTQPGKTREAIAHLERAWQRLNPAYPFTYSFLDDEYGKLYQGEQVVGRLSQIFAGLAILVSCLGLLGLAVFAAGQRVKEMGIRKVLGASAGSLATLFTMDFVRLVALAFVLAAPVGWLAMRQWLAGFAYRTELTWWLFALAGGLALLVAVLTVGSQALRAATVNPVEHLRAE